MWVGACGPSQADHRPPCDVYLIWAYQSKATAWRPVLAFGQLNLYVISDGLLSQIGQDSSPLVVN